MYRDPISDAARPTSALPDEMFVVLDPAVELLEVSVAGYRLLAHGHFETGMTIPPGDGLIEVLADLVGGPVRIDALRAAYSDGRLVDEMLASLLDAGFAHATSQAMPSDERIAALRTSAARTWHATRRRVVAIDLDDPAAVLRLQGELATTRPHVELVLHCKTLMRHCDALQRLADARANGTIRLFRVEIRTADATCDDALCLTLRRLEAAVIVEGVQWPAPTQPLPGLTSLARHGVAVHAQMVPDRSIFDRDARDRAAGWVTNAVVSGLRLHIVADDLWPATDGAEAEFEAVFEALDALGEGIGDILVETWPGDDVILGRAAASPTPVPASALAHRLRRAYLRRRIAFLKVCEGDNAWSQTPEAEDKLVRAETDLLPNNPALLGLKSGSVLVDVCGGLGRVARRMAPAVGPDGIVLSIEMIRCLSDRARQFACDRGFTNLHFRPGLAQRLPLADAIADAAVNEWTGAIWELGLGPTMIGEMVRVVRPGGRIAVTHRLVRLPLARLGEPWVQYGQIYDWVRDAFARPDLTIVAERVWGQIAPSLIGENARLWRKQYLPCVTEPFDFAYQSEADAGPHADVYLTMIAQVKDPADTS